MMAVHHAHAPLPLMGSISATAAISRSRLRLIPIHTFPFPRLGRSRFPPSSVSSLSCLVSGSRSRRLSPFPLHLDAAVGRRMPLRVRAMSGHNGGQNPKVTGKVFMEIKVIGKDDAKVIGRDDAGGHGAGADRDTARIEIELYGHLLPTIVERFIALCTPKGPKEFTYRDTEFFTVRKGLIRGGRVDRTTHDAGTSMTVTYPHYTLQEIEKGASGDQQDPETGVVAMVFMHDCPVSDYTTYGSEFVIITEEGQDVNIWPFGGADGDEDDEDDDQQKDDGPFRAAMALRDKDLAFGKVCQGMPELKELMKTVGDISLEADHALRLVITDCGKVNMR